MNRRHSSRILEQWLPLRIHSQQCIPGYRMRRQAWGAIGRYLARVCHLAERQGTLFADISEHQLNYVVATYYYYEPFYQRNMRRLVFDFNYSPEVRTQVGQLITEQTHQFDDLFTEVLAPYQSQLSPVLGEAGLKPVAHQYLGFTKISARILGTGMAMPAHYRWRSYQADFGDREWLLDLKETTFNTTPELAWYWTGSEGDRSQEAARLDSASEHSLVLLDRDRAIGYVGIHIERESPFWSKIANIDLILLPQYRGRGLMPILYRALFDRLRDLDVAYFRGITSNPAVCHYAARLQRPLVYSLWAGSNAVSRLAQRA